MKRKVVVVVAAMVAICFLLSGCGAAAEVSASTDVLGSTQELPTFLGGGELKGKVLLSNIYQDEETTSFDIYALSMQHDGEIKLVRAFKVQNTECPVLYDRELCVGVNMFFDFTENYTRLAVTRDGHVGWIDCAGNFTDVTETLQEKSEEGFTAIGFTNDGRFVYRNDDIEMYYSVNPNASPDTSMDRTPYEYQARDFLPTNQSFQKLAMEETHTCWSKFANADGNRVIFYAMVDEDVSAKKICVAPTIGGEANEVQIIPATKTVLKINSTAKYGVVYGDAILDWR